MELFSLDIETTGLDCFADQLLVIGCYNPQEGYRSFSTIDEFAAWDLPSRFYICHNGSFDCRWLKHLGHDISSRYAYDTKSIASILIPHPRLAEGQRRNLALENLYQVLLDGKVYKLDRENMASYSAEELRAYNQKDCEITYQLFEFLIYQLSPEAWDFVEKWVMPVTRLCSDVEYNGVCVNRGFLESYQKQLTLRFDEVKQQLTEMTEAPRAFYKTLQEQELEKLYAEMALKAVEKAKSLEAKEKAKRRYNHLLSEAKKKIEEFNFSSPKQLAWLMKDYYCLNILNKREGKDTTNEAKLKELDHPTAEKLCLYRELEKQITSSIPALLGNIKPDGRVHTSYHIGGTRTGRLSSSGPNLQQIPRGHIRSALQASEGTAFITVDYAQIEVRIIAEVCKEEELIRAFKDGIDPYSVIAQKLLKIDCDVRDIKQKFKKERDVAKTAGLSILYGTGAAKLQEVLNKELGRSYTIRECKEFIEDYRASFPAIGSFRQQLFKNLANQKVCYNLLGRPFYIEDYDDIYMQGLNTLVQGSASDLVLWSQTEFVIPALKELQIPFAHRLLVHDEVVIEVPFSAAKDIATFVVEPAMTTRVEQALGLVCPLKVEYTVETTWSKP